MKIRPLDDRILVKPLKTEEKTKGGIVLPDTAKEKPQQGKVITIGPGVLSKKGKRMSMLVKKGDIVLYGKYAGNEIKIDAEKYLIIKEDEVLAIVEK